MFGPPKGQIIIEIYTGIDVVLLSVAIYDVWITYLRKISTGERNDSGLERTNQTVRIRLTSANPYIIYK